jgi:hypothetical protein
MTLRSSQAYAAAVAAAYGCHILFLCADDQTRKAVRRFHFHTGDAQLLGQRVNYWPAPIPTVAKSLTEWWGRILVLSPLGESQLSYGATASIPARSEQSVDIRGTFGPPLLVFLPPQRGPLERSVAWIGKHGSGKGWAACAPKGWEGYKEVHN